MSIAMPGVGLTPPNWTSVAPYKPKAAPTGGSPTIATIAARARTRRAVILRAGL